MSALDAYRTEHDRYSAEKWPNASGRCFCWCCDEARAAIAQYRALPDVEVKK